MHARTAARPHNKKKPNTGPRCQQARHKVVCMKTHCTMIIPASRPCCTVQTVFNHTPSPTGSPTQAPPTSEKYSISPPILPGLQLEIFFFFSFWLFFFFANKNRPAGSFTAPAPVSVLRWLPARRGIFRV